MRTKKMNLRIISFILAVIAASLLLCSCAQSVKTPVLEYGDYAISLSTYEFMLSRMKGTLARNKYEVDPMSEFWKEIHPATNLTNEEYYNKSILDNCKNYLAALVIFDEEGLALSDKTVADIEEEIGFYIDYDCGGSEEKFDSMLSKYGADTEQLRTIYEIEAKYQAVIELLYGLNGSQIADSVKEEYYEGNYYRFKQILVSKFYYEFVTDDRGELIYFDAQTGKPLYDAEKGEYRYDDKGNRLVDKYGVAIRYDADGNPVYDSENGYLAPKTDSDGNAIKHNYTVKQMEERVEKMNSIIASCEGNYSAFEAQFSDWELYEGAEEYYPDGYYLSEIESSAYSQYMIDILDELKDMEEGEITVVESENGYHIVMKYALDKGKYSDPLYAEWFASFNESLINKLFLDRCSRFYSDITVNEENLKKAKSIKALGANYDY